MRERKRLVILGSGFAALSLLKKIDLDHYTVMVISPRNHFLFTPLLPSTTVGTIEFRSIIQPIRKVRRGIDFIQGECTAIDTAMRTLHCQSPDPELTFTHAYDLLVISVGAWNNTFGIPGVKEHALFLKEAVDARNIRERVVSCLERADVPGIDPKTREKLLHFVIVGGGPTGIEFAAELHDLLEEDLRKSYPNLAGHVRITVLEAAKTILNTFDEKLREYTVNHFRRSDIELRMEAPVAEVGEGFLKMKSGETIEAELIVWSTGNTATGLVESLDFPKERGRLLTDEYLRIPDNPEIYALGDCATAVGASLPQTAQLAMQEGKYLARSLNGIPRGRQPKPFRFKNLGMLAYVGESKALVDIPQAHVHGKGWLTYLFWRSAYVTRLVTLKNKVLVLFDWFKTWVFGRDLSKF